MCQIEGKEFWDRRRNEEVECVGSCGFLVYRTQSGKVAWLLPSPIPPVLPCQLWQVQQWVKERSKQPSYYPQPYNTLLLERGLTVRVHPCSSGDSKCFVFAFNICGIILYAYCHAEMIDTVVISYLVFMLWKLGDIIQLSTPFSHLSYSMQSCHILFFCLFSSCLSVFMFSCMLSVCLYVSLSSIWANTPAILPPRRPYSASQSPSNSPSACGRLLPFRQGPWFLPVGMRWLSCVMCIREPSSSSFSFAPFSAGAVGCNVQERPCCRKASVQIPVYSPPQRQWLFETGRTWKSGITANDHWMCCNKRKFWGSC